MAKAPPANISPATLSNLIATIMKLTPEQQARIADIALGMCLQKENAEKGKED